MLEQPDDIAVITWDQIISHFKTQKEAARALGVSQPTICVWQKRGIPQKRLTQITEAMRAVG